MEVRMNKKKKKGQKERRNLGGNEGKKKRKGKRKPSAGFKPVRLVLLVFMSVKWEGMVEGIGFSFLPS